MSSLSAKFKYLGNHDSFRKEPIRTLIRLLVWRVICFYKVKKKVIFKRYGFKMLLPVQWQGLSKLIFTFRDAYEPEMIFIKKRLRRNDVFIDVGAAFGIYSLLASRCLIDTGLVISIEPSRKNFAVLLDNIKINQIQNINPYNLAFSNIIGSTKLYHANDPGRNSLAKVGEFEDSENVLVESLDNFLQKNNVTKVDIIKIDVEGAEGLVIEGACSTIHVFRPIIIFEINKNKNYQFDRKLETACKFLYEEKYSFFSISNDESLIMHLEIPSGANIIAIPNDKGY